MERVWTAYQRHRLVSIKGSNLLSMIYYELSRSLLSHIQKRFAGLTYFAHPSLARSTIMMIQVRHDKVFMSILMH